MGERSSIEWTDATWNPTTGCTHVSEGCRNCYAERLAPKMRINFDEIKLLPERLGYPLHWKKPRRIFVNSLSDLFHEDIGPEFCIKVFVTMAEAKQHIFQILTKRPNRMRNILSMTEFWLEVNKQLWKQAVPVIKGGMPSVIPNVWLGVSVEDQQTANERIPLLLQTPAAVRFVSAEPLLGSITFDDPPIRGLSVEVDHQEDTRLDWVIVGGESGPHARPMHPDWARSIRDQCQTAGLPFFFKQWGEWLHESQFKDEIQRFRGLQAHRQEAGDGYQFIKLGKKAAGRLLDGREWSEYPR